MPNPAPPITPRSLAETFKALTEARISSGAYRFFHVLYHGSNHESSEARLSYREIRKRMHCDVHSIPGWIEELVAAGWLKNKAEKATKQKHGYFYIYLLCDGHGQPLFKKKSDGETNVTVTGKPTSQKVTGKPTTARRGNQRHSDVETTVGSNTTPHRGVCGSREVGVECVDQSSSPPAGAGLAPAGAAPAAPPAKSGYLSSFPDDNEPLPGVRR